MKTASLFQESHLAIQACDDTFCLRDRLINHSLFTFQVKVWFQNRRMKWRHAEEAKRKQDEEDKQKRIPCPHDGAKSCEHPTTAVSHSSKLMASPTETGMCPLSESRPQMDSDEEEDMKTNDKSQLDEVVVDEVSSDEDDLSDEMDEHTNKKISFTQDTEES